MALMLSKFSICKDNPLLDHCDVEGYGIVEHQGKTAPVSGMIA